MSGPRADGLSAEAAAFLRATSVPGRRLLPLWGPLVRLARRRRARAGRAGVEALRRRLGAGLRTVRLGGMEALEVTPRVVERPGTEYALFVHGGGYAMGAALDPVALMMADALRLPLVSLDYPLAPEARHPVMLDRCTEAYGGLAQARPGRFVVLGESAGGGLALAMLHRARAAGMPMPAALGLFTPWCDLAPAGDSFRFNEGRDPVIRWRTRLERSVRAHAGGVDPGDPELSPIHGAFDDAFPPTLVTTGTRDLFLSLCVRLYWTLRRAGAAAELRVWEGMWHSFNAVPDMPEAQECRDEMAGFLRRHLLAPRPGDGAAGEV